MEAFDFLDSTSEYRAGQWLISLVSLIPFQLAIARDTSSSVLDPEKNRPLLFNSYLAVIVRDVVPQDREGIVNEFRTKIATIIHKEKNNNFISKLFGQKMEIIPWPVIQDVNFYEEFHYLKDVLMMKKDTQIQDFDVNTLSNQNLDTNELIANSDLEPVNRKLEEIKIDTLELVTLWKASCCERLLLCVLEKKHDGNHACGTNHKCPHSCEFVDNHNEGSVCGLKYVNCF
ncbi:UNVERIFIED_CONTAM: hypothetical protein HDU68_012192 [Siphonaria sp. JEL0065]|nr:hypothetical protein HDU68_012192 [Siphonaria sp. JEL0065]